MKYVAAFCIFLAIGALTAAEQPKVRILDTLGNEPLLRKAVMNMNTQIAYNIKNTTLNEAADELKNGTADMVVCGSDTLAELKKKVKNLTAEPYAIEALGIGIHLTNKVTDISLKDLRKIFGGLVISWKDYNGTTYMIHKVAPGKNALGNLVFNRILLDNKPVAKDVALFENAAEPMIYVTGNPNALACGVWSQSLLYEVKFLTVDKIEPTLANIRSGQYPLAITYYLCSTKAIPAELLKSLTDDKQLEAIGLLSAK